jgi:glycosyltransferase involved in cell wall biosynthesis
MKIAYLHYHLKPGGVTTVLKQQVEAVSGKCDVLVLTGALPDTAFPCEVVHVPGLGYDIHHPHPLPPEDIAKAVFGAIYSKWENGCDVFHVHNPTIKKNKNFLKILNVLQNKGIRLFLQIHDFAEDGRPLSYFADQDYIHDCHYGVINSRDYGILLKSGLRKEGVHKIFNTVKPFVSDQIRIAKSSAFTSGDDVFKHYVLYPVRAIRRKNIGEAVLLSLFFKNNMPLVITLPPNSPADIKSYEEWKAFVKENKLNVVFEGGLSREFSALVLSADYLITTSISEGFGFSFLEPWTAHKMLWGRKLPDICHDFEKNSIQLNHLYTRLDVPMDWVGKQSLLDAWRTGIRNVQHAFGMSIEEPSVKNAYKKIADSNKIDFGLLNESFQRKIISILLSDTASRNQMLRLNPFLDRFGDISYKNRLLRDNLKAILHHYNPLKYGETLMGIYANVIQKNVRQNINKQKLLAEFVTPDNFSLLKWCADA